MDLMSIRRGLMAQMGNSLPSFINKLNGGTLTYDSDLTTAEQITHGLGAAPKVVIVYQLNSDITNASDSNCIIWALYVESPTGSTGAWIANSLTYFQRAGQPASVGGQANVACGVRNITSTTFDILGSSTHPLKAGITYYWLAWN